MPSFPIDSILPKLKETVRNSPSVILHAPPGAGKTTRVPMALLEVIPGRIVMLEPRRIAAASAARWMAQSINEQVGETVGYTIRFESKLSAKTRIEVVTEGILTRRIQSDPSLEGVGMVIFDEFHERSLHADLALALCLDVRKGLRQDLKLLVMSATLDYGAISALLGNAPVVASSGKAFPVEERYVERGVGSVQEQAARAVRTALKETIGDILVFLPGAGEIRDCAHKLQEAINLTDERVVLHPLYGELPFEEQERAILPSKEFRKIVLATNIAETSLTIEGVHVVIDSGLTRRLRYDAGTGMNRLVTVPVSKASSEQRKGRAGRLGPGVCFRLYGRQELQGFTPFTPAEILESDLAPLALELAAWGVKDARSLSWLNEPPQSAWDAGLRLLRDLGALDDAGSITSLGREMALLPVHPRLARLMMRSKELGCVRLGAELAALISERDLFRKTADRFAKDPDMSERVDALRAWQGKNEVKGNADRFALRTIDRTGRQLLRMVRESKEISRDSDHDNIPRLLLSAFPDRVGKAREEGGGRYLLAQGRGVRLSPDSHLINNPFVIAVTVDAGEKTEGFIHIASAVTEKLIRNECAGIIQTIRRVEWDQQESRIVGAAEERLGAILLFRKVFTPSDDEAIPILCKTIRTSPELLEFGKETRQFQARSELMRKVFPEEQWPDLSDQALLANPESWLVPWLAGMRTAHALHALDVLTALKALLSHQQQRLVEERAPTALTVPSGSRIRLDYSGEQPVLAVKLQEMFGLADTPRIAAGRVNVLLHLLSPAGRPVQITRDLKNFWNTGYPLVKKDLKGRYPKHPWPDDPWNAVPTRKTKPRP